MRVFEVGKIYSDEEGTTYKITKRTEKSVWYRVLDSEQRRKVFIEMYPHREMFYTPINTLGCYHCIYA